MAWTAVYAADAMTDSILIWWDGLLLRPGENYRNKLRGLFSGAVLLSNGGEVDVGLFPKRWLLEREERKQDEGGETRAFCVRQPTYNANEYVPKYKDYGVSGILDLCWICTGYSDIPRVDLDLAWKEQRGQWPVRQMNPGTATALHRNLCPLLRHPPLHTVPSLFAPRPGRISRQHGISPRLYPHPH